MKTKWYKIKSDRKIGGVCAGLSEMFDVDVTLIRLLWFVLIWTPFPAALSYIIAWFILPEKENIHAIHTATVSTNTNTSSTGSKEFLAG
jgi:phage shock protein C